MPIARIRCKKTGPYEVSRSRMRYRGAWSHGNASVTWREILYGQKIETAQRRQRSNVCWSWAGVAQQACRGRLSRDDGGRKQFWVRRLAQQFQCSMAVLELLARATEAWVVAAGNEHLVNR